MKTKLIGLLFVGALALLAANDPFVGTWKLNVAKSKFQGGPPPQAETVMIAADGKVSVSETDGKGQTSNWSYTAVAGAEAAITGVPDSSVTEVRKENMVDHTWKFGKSTMKGHGVVSKSGKTMTYGMQGTDPEGKPFKNTELFEKQ